MAQEPEDRWRAGAPIWPGSRWDDLAARAYAGARDENLSPDAAFDLATFLMEWAAPDPVFVELAEASMEGRNPDRVADLARRSLDAVGYAPDFAVEPQLLVALERVLAVVVHDLRATGLDGRVRLVILDGGEPRHAHIEYEGSYGSTSGLSPRGGEERSRPADTLALVADELQDAVMESVFAAWPVCPNHQFGAHARVVDDHAVWWCTASQGHVITSIGKWARSKSVRRDPG